VTGNDDSFNKFQSGPDYVLWSAWLPGRPVDSRRLAKSLFRSRKLTRYAGHVTAACSAAEPPRMARGNFLTRSGQIVDATIDSRTPSATGLIPQMRYH
jgi:hypothetical protein